MSRNLVIPLIFILTGCSAGKMKQMAAEKETVTVLNTNSGGEGPEITLEFTKGRSFFYPLMTVCLTLAH